mmetsp:Transcript_11909/g.22702  ORF Transcript_11909/g.22702 Transcript_11909/m.22702 type:complete len:741 (-) Transcript_11909:27-2249(-)
MSEINPHGISLLILIQEYVNDPKTYSAVLPFLEQQIEEPTGYMEPTLPELLDDLDSIWENGLKLAEVLSGELQAIEDPDALFDFFSEIGSLVKRSAPGSLHNPQRKLEARSRFGIYVRRLTLAFDNMMFASVARLFDNLTKYKDVSNGSMKCPRPSGNLQTFLHKKAVEIETKVGQTSFEVTESMVKEILKLSSSALLPQAHFLRYLNCLHHREFEAAVDALHSYFDYLAPQSTRDSPRGKLASSHQYAILNLAILHFGFGHYDLAVRAIQETVRIAQQSSDHVCLMHALALLCRVAQEKQDKGGGAGGGDSRYARQLLERCVGAQTQAATRVNKERALIAARQAEFDNDEKLQLPPEVPPVDSQSWLAMAKFQLEHINRESGMSDPRAVWESLTKASEVNTKHSLAALMGTKYLVHSGAWLAYGNRFLAGLFSEAQLHFCGAVSSAQDTVLGLSALAALHSNQPKTASQLLQVATDRFPVPCHNTLQERTFLHLTQQAIKKGDTQTASRLLQQLCAILPSAAQDFQLHIEGVIAKALLQASLCQHTSATAELLRAVQLCEERGELTRSVQCLLLVANICQAIGDPLSSLSYILTGLSRCQSLHLDNLGAAVKVSLAGVHLHLGSPQTAINTINEVFPQIIEHCDAEVAVDAYIIMAKCAISLSSSYEDEKEPNQGQVHNGLLQQAIAFLETARGICQQLEHYVKLRDVHYLLSRVYHAVGDFEKRNWAAAAFNRSTAVV